MVAELRTLFVDRPAFGAFRKGLRDRCGAVTFDRAHDARDTFGELVAGSIEHIVGRVFSDG